MRLLIEILVIGLIVGFAAFLIPGVAVDGYLMAVVAGVLLALANATVGGLLRLLTLPLNILTLGLVSFIITVLMVLLVDALLPGFEVAGFWVGALFALIVGLFKALLDISLLSRTPKK